MIDLDELVTEIKRLAENQPNRTSDTFYVLQKDGRFEGCCIVGTALINLGVDPNLLVIFNTRPFTEAVKSLDVEQLDDEKIQWVRSVQIKQDRRYTWSEAVA